MENILEIEGLGHCYDPQLKVLSEINFAITRGEKVGLVGANGAGKSTLLNIIAGVIMPEQGQIKIMGRVLEKASLKEIRKHLGYVFQNPEDQLFMPTVLEDLSFGLKHSGTPKQEIERRVDGVLAQFGISHLKNRSNLKLSGGEKRTVALAVAMIGEPELMVLDEPTAALDPRARRHLINQLNQLKDTMLIASHDLDFIWDTCEKVVVLHQGTILAMDKTENVLSQEKLLEQAHLELPLRLQCCPKCHQGGSQNGSESEPR